MAKGLNKLIDRVPGINRIKTDAYSAGIAASLGLLLTGCSQDGSGTPPNPSQPPYQPTQGLVRITPNNHAGTLGNGDTYKIVVGTQGGVCGVSEVAQIADSDGVVSSLSISENPGDNDEISVVAYDSEIKHVDLPDATHTIVLLPNETTGQCEVQFYSESRKAGVTVTAGTDEKVHTQNDNNIPLKTINMPIEVFMKDGKLTHQGAELLRNMLEERVTAQ